MGRCKEVGRGGRGIRGGGNDTRGSGAICGGEGGGVQEDFPASMPIGMASAFKAAIGPDELDVVEEWV
jgi:hypothetical protein